MSAWALLVFGICSPKSGMGVKRWDLFFCLIKSLHGAWFLFFKNLRVALREKTGEKTTNHMVLLCSTYAHILHFKIRNGFKKESKKLFITMKTYYPNASLLNWDDSLLPHVPMNGMSLSWSFSDSREKVLNPFRKLKPNWRVCTFNFVEDTLQQGKPLSKREAFLLKTFFSKEDSVQTKI